MTPEAAYAALQEHVDRVKATEAVLRIEIQNLERAEHLQILAEKAARDARKNLQAFISDLVGEGDAA